MHRETNKKIFLQKVYFGNVICTVFSHLPYKKEWKKKANLSFSIIFHIFFSVKQNNPKCFGSTKWFNTGKTMVPNMNLVMNEFLHLGKQLFPYQWLCHFELCFTSALSSGSHFASTKTKWNITFSGSIPYTLHYTTVRKQDFFPLWAHGTVTMISHWAPRRLTKHYFTSCEISFMSAYGKGERRTHTRRQFPVLMGVMEKRELSK